MPRRVYTYPAVLGWDVLNLVSTVGAFLFAAGVLVFLVDLARNLRPTVSEPVGNVWKARRSNGCPTTSTGRAASRWSRAATRCGTSPGSRRIQGRAPLPARHRHRRRETIVTSPIEATPQYLLRLPGPGWPPFLAAVFTAGFFLLLTVKLVTLARLRRARAGDDPDLDVEQRSEAAAPRRDRRRHQGADLCVGPLSHSWWAMVV